MDWTDVGRALATVAPMLANAILPGVGGPAVAILERVLGVDAGTLTPAAAIAAVQALTPEQRAALIHAQNELPIAQMQNQLATLGAQLADIADARKRDATLQASGKRNIRADYMVVGVTLGLIVSVVTVAIGKGSLAGEAIGLIATVAGTFCACLKDAFQFEFGTSRRNQETDTLLAQMVLPAPPARLALPAPAVQVAREIDGLPWLKAQPVGNPVGAGGN